MPQSHDHYQRTLPLGNKPRDVRIPVSQTEDIGRELAKKLNTIGLICKVADRTGENIDLISEVGEALTTLSKYLNIYRLVWFLGSYQNRKAIQGIDGFYTSSSLIRRLRLDCRFFLKDVYSPPESKEMERSFEYIVQAMNHRIYINHLRKNHRSSGKI